MLRLPSSLVISSARVVHGDHGALGGEIHAVAGGEDFAIDAHFDGLLFFFLMD